MLTKLPIVRYFVLAAFFPLLYTLVSGIILLSTDTVLGDYGMEFFSLTVLSLFATISSLTILLNKHRAIALNPALRLLSWFLTPLIVLTLCFSPFLVGNTRYFPDSIYYHSMSILAVHLLTLSISYFGFTRSIHRHSSHALS